MIEITMKEKSVGAFLHLLMGILGIFAATVILIILMVLLGSGIASIIEYMGILSVDSHNINTLCIFGYLAFKLDREKMSIKKGEKL